MHEVIKVYGKTILQAIILVGVMWLVFRGVTDENGNKGIVEIVSGHMDQQMENPADFETFYEVRVVALLKQKKVQHIYARAIDAVHRSVLEAFELERILTR